MRVSKVLRFFLFQQGEISTFRADFGKNQQVKTWLIQFITYFSCIDIHKTCFLKNTFFFVAAELLTSVVYQPYMPPEIQPRYKTPIFDPFCSPSARLLLPSFPFSPVSLFMADESGTFYQKCALRIAISQNRPKYFHK